MYYVLFNSETLGTLNCILVPFNWASLIFLGFLALIFIAVHLFPPHFFVGTLPFMFFLHRYFYSLSTSNVIVPYHNHPEWFSLSHLPTFWRIYMQSENKFWKIRQIHSLSSIQSDIHYNTLKSSKSISCSLISKHPEDALIHFTA